MTLRLLKTHTLSISRKDPDTGYIDPTTRRWVEGTATAIDVQGSLQPFRSGESLIDLPEGIRTQDTRVFYSVDEIKTELEEINQEADETVIDNIAYKCFFVEPWKGLGLSIEHYRSIFIRKDKLSGGV